MTSRRDHNNLPVTETKDVEIYDFPDKEFKQLFSGNSMSYNKMQDNNT